MKNSINKSLVYCLSLTQHMLPQCGLPKFFWSL